MLIEVDPGPVPSHGERAEVQTNNCKALARGSIGRKRKAPHLISIKILANSRKEGEKATPSTSRPPDQPFKGAAQGRCNRQFVDGGGPASSAKAMDDEHSAARARLDLHEAPVTLLALRHASP